MVNSRSLEQPTMILRKNNCRAVAAANYDAKPEQKPNSGSTIDKSSQEEKRKQDFQTPSPPSLSSGKQERDKAGPGLTLW